MALASGDFGLYTHNNQFYFDTVLAGGDFEFNLTTPMSGDISIYSKGGNVEYTSIGLYSNGRANSSGTLDFSIPSGAYVRDSYLSIYTNNRVPDSGNIDIYSRGLDSASGDINVWQKGMVSQSGNVNLYSFGAYLESGVTVDVYSRGVEFLPFYTVGGITGRKWGSSYSNMSLYAENVQPEGSTSLIGDTVDFYIEGGEFTEYSQNLPIYIKSDNGYSSGVLPITLNSRILERQNGHISFYSNATDSSGVMGGIYDNLGIFQMGYYGGRTIVRDTSWKESSGVLSLYTERDEAAAIPLYLQCGPFSASGDISSYITGAYNNSGNIQLYTSSDNFLRSGDIPIYMEANNIATLPLYIHNSASVSGTINFFDKGILANNLGNMPTYLYGNGKEISNMSLYLHGF